MTFTPGSDDDRTDTYEAQLDLQKDDLTAEQEFNQAQTGLQDANTWFQRTLGIYGALTDKVAPTVTSTINSIFEFNNEDNFRNKLDALKESYFPKTVVEQTATFDDEDGSTAQDIDTTDAISAYMSAISRNKKASA